MKTKVSRKESFFSLLSISVSAFPNTVRFLVKVITGSADSVIVVWKDYTLTEQKENNVKQKQRVLQEQELSNCLREKNYKRAVSLAFTLEQPARLYKVSFLQTLA
jgi:bisphosphoglycerate-dependent phosphoglycerate mutase